MPIQNPQRGKTIFFAGSFFDLSSEVMGNELKSVADAQDGEAQLEEAWIRVGRVRLIDTLWPAG